MILSIMQVMMTINLLTISPEYVLESV